MAGSGWDAATAGPGVQLNADGTAERPMDGGGGSSAGIRANAGRSKGKRYFEIDATSASCSVGVVDASADVEGMLGSGANPSQWGFLLQDGYIYYRDASGSGSADKGVGAVSSVVGVLVDFDAKAMTVYSDGGELFAHALSFANGVELFPAVSMGTSTTGVKLQTVEPFSFPPAVSFIAWDKPDSALASRISGTVTFAGSAVSRLVRAFTFDRLNFDLNGDTITESKPLGQSVSDDQSGNYSIILRDGFPREVFVVAFDDYGAAFQSGLSLAVGDRVHPTTPTGLVYECDGAGELPAIEPAPWPTDDTQSHAIGTASFQVKPFARPVVHGPIVPEILDATAYDQFWSDVALLMHFDGDLGDRSEVTKSTEGHNGAATTATGALFGKSLSLNGSNQYVSVAHHASLSLAGKSRYTIDVAFSTDAGGKIQTLVTKRSGANEYSLLIDTDDRLGFLVWGSGSSVIVFIKSVTVLAQSQFYQVRAAVKDGNAYLFVDGKKEAETSFSGSFGGNSSDVMIGRDPTNSARYFSGLIDEVRLTDGVCRATEDYDVRTDPFPEQSL